MRFSLPRALGYAVGGLWTGWGGRKRIEAKQLGNMRRLVEKARRDSPLFGTLYADLRARGSVPYFSTFVFSLVYTKEFYGCSLHIL